MANTGPTSIDFPNLNRNTSSLCVWEKNSAKTAKVFIQSFTPGTAAVIRHPKNMAEADRVARAVGGGVHCHAKAGRTHGQVNVWGRDLDFVHHPTSIMEISAAESIQENGTN